MPRTTVMLMATVLIAAGAAAAVTYQGLSRRALTVVVNASTAICINRTERYELSSQAPFYLSQPRCAEETAAR